MLLTLLLALGDAGEKAIDHIVWGLALVLWLPQLLVARLVLRKRLPLLLQLLLLLTPIGLLLTMGIQGLLLVVLMVAYSEVPWVLWGLVVLLPTLGAMCFAVSRAGFRPNTPQDARSAPTPPSFRTEWTIVAGVGLLLAATLGRLILPTLQEAPAEPQFDAAAQAREDRARRVAEVRADSLRFLEENTEPTPPSQPW